MVYCTRYVQCRLRSCEIFVHRSVYVHCSKGDVYPLLHNAQAILILMCLMLLAYKYCNYSSFCLYGAH